MDMYLFDDVKMASELKEAGIPVILTNHGGEQLFAVPDKPEYAKYLMTHYQDLKLRKTGIVCF